MGINFGGYRPNPAGPPGWLKNTIPKSQRLLTVHNTFSSPKETDALHAHFHNIWFCTCPSANLYITGIIPRRETLLSSADRWCIGTDSLASNNALDILQEMRILQETHAFNLEKLIPMATLHGACALGLDSELGSFEPGKKPGIVHLSNVNYKELLILPETRSCLI
jgi:cytosine/adenosine deaminase-related metal-dependent hydrolase